MANIFKSALMMFAQMRLAQRVGRISGAAKWAALAALCGLGAVTALLAALVTVIVMGLIDPDGDQGAGLEWIFDSVIAPGQSTLFALLAFFLAAAAYRYLRIGRTGGAWMLAGALFMLVVQMPASQRWLPSLGVSGMAWLLTYPVMAAMRGVVLGSALAFVVFALFTLLHMRKE